ncbi:hypothetical protein Ddc_19092 [Ditylenchus destructor]|nr:hypothetical protein Ddc_19092 [Ditylenchus destructor]
MTNPNAGLFQSPANDRDDNIFKLQSIKMLRFNGTERTEQHSGTCSMSRMMSRTEKYTRLLSLLYAHPLVIEALKKRYGQKKVFAKNVQAELLNTPPAQDKVFVSGPRPFCAFGATHLELSFGKIRNLAPASNVKKYISNFA